MAADCPNVRDDCDGGLQYEVAVEFGLLDRQIAFFDYGRLD